MVAKPDGLRPALLRGKHGRVLTSTRWCGPADAFFWSVFDSLSGWKRLIVAVMPKTPSAPHLINRRFFLRAAGITLALPLFESLGTRVLGSGIAVGSQAGEAVTAKRPVRLVCQRHRNVAGDSRRLGVGKYPWYPAATAARQCSAD